MSNNILTEHDRHDTSDAGSVKTTIAGMSDASTTETIVTLQDRLVATLDLQLTLKHIHWNVVGMNFIAIHEMLDPQVDAVRLQSDELAERIAPWAASRTVRRGRSPLAGRGRTTTSVGHRRCSTSSRWTTCTRV